MTFLYLGLGSFILGIVLLIYYPIHNAQNKRRSERTEGTITKVDKRTIRKKEAGTGDYWYDTSYIYTVEYKVNGQLVSFKSSPSPAAHEEGESLTVCYNPDKPQDAHILESHGDSSNIILYVGLACIAVAVISIFLFIHSL